MDARASDRRGFFRETFDRLLREVTARAEQRVAPRHAIIKAPPAAGLAAATPIIDPGIQACVVCQDMPCARACPTGALTPPPDGWADVHMGILELDPERCITFQGVSCGVCARACPVGERALALDAGGRPVIRPEGCVGCGVCVTVCVTSPSSLRLSLVP